MAMKHVHVNIGNKLRKLIVIKCNHCFGVLLA